ncbi:hypothetical protein CAPTEDRAFT_214826 [Capitella teleta]|uniref:Uncharacterized protein n=1 Tax=Capitella teleta TaxID=283909 RepID=R7V1R8_CAPTE|nr:hypothetical protein CAPTEDRAFT_214826 [Capitella teleta]|eukprot:ELU12499.1 hypothetical protein CAPTEDRAFT_214826 [Capitella teleta]
MTVQQLTQNLQLTLHAIVITVALLFTHRRKMTERKGKGDDKKSEEEGGFSWLGAGAALVGGVALYYVVKKFGNPSSTSRDYGEADSSNRNSIQSAITFEPGKVTKNNDDTIQRKLQSYFNEYVQVSDASMKEARKVMENIIGEAGKFIREHKSLETANLSIDALIPTGSSTDGLKVIQADEFDVLMPIPLSSKTGWSVKFLSDDPSFAKLSNESYDHKIPTKYFDDYCNLSSVKIKGLFQGILQKFVNEKNKAGDGIALKTGGPALTLLISHSDDKRMSVDIVPCVKIDDFSMVLKPHPSTKEPDKALHHPDAAVLWMKSYSMEEKEEIAKHYDDFTKCLMIMKCLRVNNAQLATISSYVLKTAYLYWRGNMGASAVWDEDELLVNFRNFAEFLKGKIDDEKLCPFFECNPKANLLKRQKKAALTNLSDFIAGNILTHELSGYLADKKPGYI